MKLEIQDFKEDDSSAEENDEDVSPAETPATNLPLTKCEVREYEARYNLKGERVTKLIESKIGTENAVDPNEGDKKYAMASTKYYDRQGKVESKQLEIFSSVIKLALRTVIKAYPSVSFEGESIILQETACIFHYRQELATYRDKLADKVSGLDISLLLRYMESELRNGTKLYRAHVETASTPSITFSNLWMIFRPGELVVTGKGAEDQIMVLEETSLSCGENPSWSVTGWIVTHDGTSFGKARRSKKVDMFAGPKDITKLSILPLKYHPDEKALQKKHITRGKKFCDLRGSHHMYYEGLAQALGAQLDRNIWGQLNEYPLETAMV